MKKSQRETQRAIEERLCQGFKNVGGKDDHRCVVYEHDLEDGEELKEALFWEEEIQQKLKEQADEILAYRLIQQEKTKIIKESQNTSQAVEDSNWASEIARVENEFEEATRARHHEMSEQYAAKLQKQFGEIDRRSSGTPTKHRDTKLKLFERLIGRIRNNHKNSHK